MPTYDYECRACGEKLEIFHGMTEAPRKKCPKCGKATLERLIGAGGGLIFKGSGFYITDYRSSDYQAQAKADSGSKSGSASESKSDSKPETKSEAKPPKDSSPSQKSSETKSSEPKSPPSKSSGDKKKKTAD